MNKLQYMTISPACPCCCSAYMEEHEDYWVCPVCGAVGDCKLNCVSKEKNY